MLLRDGEHRQARPSTGSRENGLPYTISLGWSISRGCCGGDVVGQYHAEARGNGSDRLYRGKGCTVVEGSPMMLLYPSPLRYWVSST